MKQLAEKAGKTKTLWIAAVLAVFVLVSLAVAADWWIAVPADAERSYVGSQSCIQCHKQEVHAWTGSDHDLAMDLTTEETVLGDFDDAEFTYQGVTSRMFRRDGKFFINTEGPDGEMADFEVKYTFGVRPLQQYMIEFPDGRVQVLRISWDTEKKKWFYVPPPDVTDEKIEPGDPLHWTGIAQNWNTTCAECHSTNLEKNYDLDTDTYKTTWTEIDVSCEACHGPASLHVELARSKSLFWDRHHGYGLAKLKGKDPTAQLETCAKCHSRRNMVHPDYTPGENFLDYYDLQLLHEPLYHADGQILDEVYVYGSFLQSKMFHKNVRCTDCHDPHSTRLKFEGNKLCAQCHQPGKYDTPAHHHHDPGTKGAQCVECHMPATTYMVVDPRRDHSLRVPRPDLTVKLGTPNACNNCHTKPEESAEWAAEKVRQWYGDERPDDPHYAPAFHVAREGTPEGEDRLHFLLKRGKQTPAIIRATAVELLGQYDTPASREARTEALEDESPLVRAAAARAADPQPDVDRQQTSPQLYQHKYNQTLVRKLAPLLSDDRRAVRVAAAQRLAGVPSRYFSAKQQDALEAGLTEYVEQQMANAERAGSHLNLGNLFQNMGQVGAAEEAFKKAIRLEPYLAGARSNLAELYQQQQKNPVDVKRLREEELELLARDAEMLPDNPVAQFRYGSLLYMLGKPEEALEAIKAAVRLDPGSYQYRLMLTLLYEKLEMWNEAFRSLQVQSRMRPNDPAIKGLAQRMMQAMSADDRDDQPPVANDEKPDEGDSEATSDE